MRLTDASLAAYPDNTGIRMYRASFRGLLGQEEAFATERQQVLDAGFHGYQLHSLAATHAYLGEPEAAVEELARAVEGGSINPIWKLYLTVAAPGIRESPTLRPFLDAHGAEEARLRNIY